MGFRGIKNRVLVVFWILFFVSMVFMDVLIVSIFLQHSLTRITQQKRSTLAFICDVRAKMPPGGHPDSAIIFPDRLPDGDRFFSLTHDPSVQTDVSEDQLAGNLESLVMRTLQSGEAVTRNFGRSFGIFFWQYRSVVVTQAVQSQGKTITAAGIEVDLTGIYEDYRRIQKIAFVFILIISLFFALIANRQLARIYFQPLKRLALRAESYQDESPLFFSVRKEDNEFSILSASLNKMLHRIAEDKNKLQETIESLKSANRQLKQAQDDVINAEKLASVGRLTSGIAHEIGNPIGIVLGYLDLLKQTDLDPLERSDFIDRSEKEINRINHIIRQLLDMSRSSTGEPQQFSIHHLLTDLISVFDFQAGAADINFKSQFDANPDLVFADPDRLRQVFLNILLNAVDAVNMAGPSDPCITIATETIEGSKRLVVASEITVIRITIEDNGPGIDSSHLTRIFDPFFTTKEPGKGTGLGLSVSYMIVEKMGGKLSVISKAGDGTAFCVDLPFTVPCDDNPPPV